MPQSSMKIVTVRPCTPVHIYMYTEVIIICYTCMYTVKYIVHVHLQYNYGENRKTDMERGYSSCPHLESNLH